MRAAKWLASLLGSWLSMTAAGSATSGCTTEAACFQDCSGQSPSTTGGDDGTGGKGLAGTPTLGGSGTVLGGSGGKVGGGSGGLDPTPTECEGVDLDTDVNNCGACGKHCVITGADSLCVDGECAISACLPNRYDVNGNPEDGCELLCDGDPDADESCNGEDDDCDGVKDEGFDLDNDGENCGACGNTCSLQHASALCTEGGCKIDECEAGFHSVDGLASNGCEYPCQVKDKNGVVCDPATAPAGDGCGVEICDDIDQNCDGQINEGNPGGNDQCSDFCPTEDCAGTCTFGTTQCIGSVVVCIPGVTPAADVCDGLDNNCDGTPDEDFDFDSDPQNCGACGNSCVGMVPHAIAKCENQQCQIDVCETNYGNLDPSTPGCEACPVTPVRAETCNGKDDDCDGSVDEPLEVLMTKPSAGYCKERANTKCHNIAPLCKGSLGWVCQYPAGVEVAAGKVVITETKCDGIDGNCDGQTDEAFLALGDDCDDGAPGVCLDHGEVACNPTDSSKTYCDTSPMPDPPNGAPFATESCNGLDDDCDGEVDEGTDQMVHITRNTLDFWIDKYEASRPDATGSSPGTDETHLCGIPGRMPWTGATFDEAESACVASGKRLCKIAELEEACEGVGNRTYPYGSSYVPSSCNGIDAPGSAAAPTGSFAACVSTDGVFDLSGNVGEWSSTDKGDTTGVPKYDIMALQGGSYLTPQNGLTCRFDLDVISTNAVLASLGFRCCKDP